MKSSGFASVEEPVSLTGITISGGLNEEMTMCWSGCSVPRWHSTCQRDGCLLFYLKVMFVVLVLSVQTDIIYMQIYFYSSIIYITSHLVVWMKKCTWVVPKEKSQKISFWPFATSAGYLKTAAVIYSLSAQRVVWNVCLQVLQWGSASVFEMVFHGRAG